MSIPGLPGYLAAQISPQVNFWQVPGRFELESGDALDDVVVAYRTWGNPANAAQRAILVCHALTGSSDVDAWWPQIIGTGKAFDPEHDFVICANILGSCYGTTGPASLKPDGSERYRADFPAVTVRDMVRLQRRLLDALGIERLELVTGPSLGGMQALEWALMYPGRVHSVVPIGVGGRHSAWCIGVSEAQRAAIAADPNWNGGYYSDDAPPDKGLAAARMMAICTYRSWQSFDARFGRDARADEL
ncbi:MAG: homoserine O-acetyltransferase, partial [Woeseiaceae bacterium]|nr:homoserine O-acetyltransferase [Woeseiaceae bacterium]